MHVPETRYAVAEDGTHLAYLTFGDGPVDLLWIHVIDGKYGGLTVTLGARIAATAGPGEVLVSRTLKDLVAGSGFSFETAGEHELKGVPDRWPLFRVVAMS